MLIKVSPFPFTSRCHQEVTVARGEIRVTTAQIVKCEYFNAKCLMLSDQQTAFTATQVQ